MATRTNEEFRVYARRSLHAWAQGSAPELDRDWTYVLEGGRRIVRCVLRTSGGMIFNLREVSEAADPETLHRWALDVVGVEDDYEARRLSGYDPRRASERSRSAWVELRDRLGDLLEDWVAGWDARATDFGGPDDREFVAEVSADIERFRARIAEFGGAS